MRTRFNPKAIEQMNEFDRYIKDREKIQEIIKENEGKKVYLEIGMGKGDFITALSQLDKDNIYIGIEVSPPVLALAIKKLKRYEEENNTRLDNLYFMSFDAIELSEMFLENQIEKIYLNFSDPWPKKKHEGRRFVNPNNLRELARLLKKNGILQIATDHAVYKGWVLHTMAKDKNFVWTAKSSDDWRLPPADWFETKYQRKAVREGRKPVFFEYQRV